MPPEELTEVGLITARVERAAMGLGEIGRVHVNRWGDGGGHFHLWFMPRPLGRLQLRGSMLPMWMDVLPEVDSDTATAALSVIARGLGTGGGTVHC
jgi:hypothetical protein